MTRAPRKTPTPPGALHEEDADIHSLVENPRNTKNHPDEQISRLMASLTLRGQYRSVLARADNRMLIAGHGVRQAALRLGWTKIKVAFWDVDQDTADRVMLGDNRLAQLSKDDEDRISQLLQDVPEDEWLSLGYSGPEGDKLMKDLSGRELQVEEMEVGTVHDTFWINVRGPLPEQAVVLQRMKELLGEYRSVTIEVGLTEQP